MRIVGEIVAIPVCLVIAWFLILPYWRIFSRAGFSGWLSVLTLVPVVNLIVLYYVAFAKWNVRPEPVLRRTAKKCEQCGRWESADAVICPRCGSKLPAATAFE